MLGWLRQLLPSGRSQPSPAVAQALRLIRARYDAAVTNDENRRHWAHADNLSANAANSPDVRRLLRNRARYEVANNSYARGIVLTLANDVIGTGPRLQILTGNSEANHQIELEWMRWSRTVGLPEKLRTLRMARASDGEGFAALVTNPKLPTPVQLDLNLIEADQVTTPDLYGSEPNAIDGITFDRFGNPVEYHLLRQHPGDPSGMLYGEYIRVPARNMIHYYRRDRAGQGRGIPDITPALPLFAHLRRYTLAVITAAEIAAIPGGVLYTDAPANGEADSVEPMDLIELERGMLMTMPGGWKMNQLEAAQPTTTYAEFKKEILNEIARCLNMPFAISAGNSSGYNYASGRLDHQMYFKAVRVEQAHLEAVVLDRILAAWLAEAALIPGYLPHQVSAGFAEHTWFFDGHEHVDPLKESSAQALRLANHTTTYADEYARRGLDWETQLRQRAKELELMNQLGLKQASGSRRQASGEEDETDDFAQDDHAEHEPAA
ncbi:phage portal protein [Planctomicrobium sp. SH661]|uniref:phage portal protein n=1 Tax=Planctomicrobium sp. SH661 TaxID=3448124 RepID=UPI003F5B2F1C